jgi:hypothetical protein
MPVAGGEPVVLALIEKRSGLLTGIGVVEKPQTVQVELGLALGLLRVGGGGPERRCLRGSKRFQLPDARVGPLQNRL